MNAILDMSFISELVMVDIQLWNKRINDYSQMLITVDTGASVTTISTDLLHILGYNISNAREYRIITASSVEYVKSVVLDSIMLGNIKLENIEVYAHNFPESSFSMGVLGLNVLKRFDIFFRFSKKEMELISQPL